ncbi:hypothetical protein LTR53_001111 [Teratosphaeriaceae sp. CCFEE 6253]|nr:hypothetical protein LTR53_001111 [Teratosphaeriaceae sp. CCFEE 6253]
MARTGTHAARSAFDQRTQTSIQDPREPESNNTNSANDMTTTIDDKGKAEKAFNFFGLPRELRNAIYAECLPDHAIKPRCLPPGTELVGFFRPEMRLVCKRLKQEHEEEAVRDAELVVDVALPPLRGWHSPGVLAKKAITRTDIQRLPFRFLAGLRRLKLKIGQGAAGGPDHLASASDFAVLRACVEVEMSRLLMFLPSSPTLIAEITIAANALHDEELEGDAGHRRSSFDVLHCAFEATKIAQSGAITTILIEKAFFVVGKLYDVWADATDDGQHAESTRAILAYSPLNRIIYKAALAKAGYADGWYGLDLEVVEAGVYDYDAALEEAQLSSMASSDDSDYEDYGEDEDEYRHGGDAGWDYDSDGGFERSDGDDADDE